MKVLWLLPTKPPNISVRHERIAEELEQRGIDVTFQDASGVDAVRAVGRAIFSDFDVLIGTVRMGLYVGYPLSTILHKPLLADVTDPIHQIDHLPARIYRFFRWYEFVILGRADASTFVYESSHHEAMARGINGTRVPNGVDYALFQNPPPDIVTEAGNQLRRVGVDLHSPIAIYIGGLTDSYHISTIIDAAIRSPDWEFVFVGDGDLRSEVSTAARTVDNVFYPGSFDYRFMPGFLSHSDAGLCLVDAEQPLKILEYGAASLPVIAARGELERRFSSDEVIFIEPTPEPLTNALEGLITDPTTAQRYGVNLKRRAAASSWEEIADTYERVLTSIT